jgi:hypothetical protein
MGSDDFIDEANRNANAFCTGLKSSLLQKDNMMLTCAADRQMGPIKPHRKSPQQSSASGAATGSPLFIVCPHPNNFYSLEVTKNLIHQAVLYIDASGIGAREVAHEFLKRWWILVGVLSKDVQ